MSWLGLGPVLEEEELPNKVIDKQLFKFYIFLVLWVLKVISNNYFNKKKLPDVDAPVAFLYGDIVATADVVRAGGWFSNHWRRCQSHQ